MAIEMLAWSGLAAAQSAAQSLPPYKPTKRGGGGPLRPPLWWQAPTLLNPHFGRRPEGHRRVQASSTSRWPPGTPTANLIPILATEIPSLQNGGVARDGMSVTWKLKRNVNWHDGKPFTADDVVFTWEYVSDPATAAVSSGVYKEVRRVEKVERAYGAHRLQRAGAVLGPAVRGLAAGHDPFRGTLRSLIAARNRARRRGT